MGTEVLTSCLTICEAFTKMIKIIMLFYNFLLIFWCYYYDIGSRLWMNR